MKRLLFNGHINTNQPGQPEVSALVADHGQVIAVGSDQELLAEFGSQAEKYDLQGRTVWPGLTDAHIHMDYYSLGLSVVDCETPTRAECIRRVAERVRNTPPGKWVRGHGWNQNVWPEGFGSVKELDEVAPDNPVYLTTKSVHGSWANSAALRIAGINSSTPDPQNGIIVRDVNGAPTGILLESAAYLVERCLPEPAENDLLQAMRDAQETLWQLGITGVHDYDGSRCFSTLQKLDLAGELRLRVVKGIPMDMLPHAIQVGLRSGFGSQYLRIGSLKLFADGALGPQTAAMLQPYERHPGNTGILFMDGEQIFEQGQQAAAGGISVAVHAIGDRANHEVLNAYAQLRGYETEHNLPHLRHRIEHVQCLHPEDYDRLAKMDVIASVQPIHATSDMLIADQFWGSRSVGAYAFRTLLDKGTRLAFGSDAPVEVPNPWLGLHAAVTRRRPDGSPDPQGWYPAQRLSLHEALQGYTTGPAFAAGQEKTLGGLTPGCWADLIVLESDPFDIPTQELHAIRPIATMVGGDWVWQKR
jgi:predicted amidohydrolase YtcJ